MALGLTQSISFQTSVTCVPCCMKNSCCNINDLPNVLYVTFLPFTHTETVQLAYGLSGTSSIEFPGVGPIPLIKKNVLVNNIFYDPNNFPTSNIVFNGDPPYNSIGNSVYVYEFIEPEILGQGIRNGGPFTFDIKSLKRWDYQTKKILINGIELNLYAGPDWLFTNGYPASYDDPLAIPQAEYSRTLKMVRLYCIGSNYVLQWTTQSNDAFAGFFSTNNTQIYTDYPQKNGVFHSCSPFFALAQGAGRSTLHKFSAVYQSSSEWDYINYYRYYESGPMGYYSLLQYRTVFSGAWKAIITE